MRSHPHCSCSTRDGVPKWPEVSGVCRWRVFLLITSVCLLICHLCTRTSLALIMCTVSFRHKVSKFTVRRKRFFCVEVRNQKSRLVMIRIVANEMQVLWKQNCSNCTKSCLIVWFKYADWRRRAENSWLVPMTTNNHVTDRVHYHRVAIK